MAFCVAVWLIDGCMVLEVTQIDLFTTLHHVLLYEVHSMYSTSIFDCVYMGIWTTAGSWLDFFDTLALLLLAINHLRLAPLWIKIALSMI